MVDQDALIESLERFAKEHMRYPSKKECKELDYLFGYNTYTRKLGLQEDWQILERVYTQQPRCCLHCSEVILFSKRTNKFCNQSCAAKYNNPLKRVITHCECGTTLPRPSSIWCSTACYRKRVYLDSLEAWLKTGSFQTNRTLRRFLTDTRGYRCEICNFSQWNGKPLTLDVDHTDGDNTDCSPENVRFLCPNCHSQTDTYKNKNKGNGRIGRMERYREGKTY